MMNKLVACFLALLMMVGLGTGALAQSADGDTAIPVSQLTRGNDAVGIQRGTSLTVGATSAMTGHFGTSMWGNNTADVDVRSLLHAYDTVAWTSDLSFSLNGVVVKNATSQANADGSRTYTLTLNEGLTYNDGTPVTAKDYVFALLLTSSPEVAAIGGSAAGKEHIAGYTAFASGAAKNFSGIRLLSDMSFSIQVVSEYLPYFYGTAMLTASPMPVSVIAPGCEVRDDGAGAYITAAGNASSLQATGYTPGQFSAEMLRVTMLDPQTGYEFAPQVTTGPYSLESYNAQTQTATFVLNEAFAGNYEGQKPHIERLTFTHVTNENMIEKLQSGEVGLLNKVMREDTIAKGQNLIVDPQANIMMSSYPRSGFSFLAFACEDGPTSSEAVRKAIALSFDIDGFVTQVAGNTALRVYGYYGLGQWMTTYSVTDQSGAQLQVQSELQKLAWTRDISAAIDLLDKDGWNLNDTGRSFIRGVDTVRHRQGTNGLEKLEISWAKMQDSTVADALETVLTEAFRELGISLVVTEVPYEQLLKHYYREEARTYDMFYLATNFTHLFDPYYDFHTGDAYQGVANKLGLRDDTLMRLALEMRDTVAASTNEYVLKWLQFEQRFVELMPMVPLYSNIYFDFHTSALQNYDIENHVSWANAIVYATLQN